MSAADATWDCHVHVVDDRFPLATERAYTPARADAAALAAHLVATGSGRAVIVQPSPYGPDNGATLDALGRLGPRHRAVIAPGPPLPTLLALREKGVRGLRLNPLGRIVAPTETLAAEIARLGRLCAEAGLALELALAVPALAGLRGVLDALPCPVVLPHFAGLLEADAALARGELARHFAAGRMWIKVSAIDRFEPDAPDFDQRLHRAVDVLRAEAPARILYGSDWPHTPFHADGRAQGDDAPRPHRAVDDRAAQARLERALGPALWRAARVENPEALYDG
jgi:predicted TIM-barrel fold metal-dependent hydrolase